MRVAGTRWCVEESFQAAKGQVGLDHYQIRGWTPWHRFITLTMLALAILATLTTAAVPAPDPDRYARQSDPIALATSEIRRLLNVLLVKPVYDLAHLLHWSNWRRHHQAAARRAHYQRRLAT